MSFRDLEGGRPGGSRQGQPKQRKDDDSPIERTIKANIQEMQDNVRLASEQLERASRSFLSRRMGETLDKFLERSRELAEETEQLFRDWTVQLAGEPSERQRKKFSFDKLQKAFEEEVAHLKETARQAVAAQQEARNATGPSTIGLGSMCEEQSANDEVDSDDDKQGLLDDSGAPRCLKQAEDTSIQSRIAMEREEGIRRIQSQVSEVNQIFRDLASICTDQGSNIETIESQASESVASTKEGNSELKKAADRQRSTRERLCCMLIAGVIVLCLVILPHTHALGMGSRTVPVVASAENGVVVGEPPQDASAQGAPTKSWGFDGGTRVISKTGQALT